LIKNKSIDLNEGLNNDGETALIILFKSLFEKLFFRFSNRHLNRFKFLIIVLKTLLIILILLLLLLVGSHRDDRVREMLSMMLNSDRVLVKVR
jgi:small-conductance mechanosensitive channel